MQKDKIFRSANIQEDNKERRNSYNLNRWRNYVIPLIVVILAIITYQYLPSFKVYEFTFEDVLKYAREFGYEFDKLPSNEEINKNIINCTSVALRIEQSVAFNETGPELMADLNTFSSQLEIAKSSYTIMYTEGALFIWNFEQFINESLNYISNDSFMPLIWNNNLQSSIKESIEALKIFYSSVEKALEATSMAESFRKGTHKQVIRAKKEVQQFILSVDNPNFIKRILYLIGSITDTTERNNLAVDYSIATEIDTLLTYLDSDLKRVAKILLGFKENLEKHSSFLLKLEASIEPLKKLKGNEREIKKVRELLDMIKENHKNFKARVNQVDSDNNK